MGTGKSSRGCGNRRTQERQVNDDDLMECFNKTTLSHKNAESVRTSLNVCL